MSLTVIPSHAIFLPHSPFLKPLLFPSTTFSSSNANLRRSGRKSLPLHYQNQGASVESLDLKVQHPEMSNNLYPDIEPYNTGYLKVSDIHTLFYEQSGNPSGYPIVFIHGGPGGGTSPSNRKFFDPEFYRIILFDQRGAGKSTPHACLVENTTWNLIEDIEKLREHLEIPEWQIFGGSWGSTLALAYSQSYPDKVTGLVLRGIFLLRQKEIDWFYEGGAATIFPDAWEPFRDLIPKSERGCFIKAYHKRLNSDDKEIQYAASRAWTKWEMMTAHLIPNEVTLKKGDDDEFCLAFARIENHYFMNKGFFPSDSFLLDNIDKIKHINTVIVQVHASFLPMFQVVPDAGHSANESGISDQLVAATNKLKDIIKEK
ncbi:proline iminopeptidase [Olea europaea var. sylvestris]|uniref:proline iminopeptidase n=1 Tax=Olea europaea var. sylvestris TaxID=158386 RepID=UPI000C1D1403|nr:proline iminopeptidase [Olea europaea var. sylvestris]